jgi:tRNA (cmo5U34)-methyltransferase
MKKTAPPKSAWQTEELVALFLKDVRGAIPGAELQLTTLRMIAQLWRPQAAEILDLGCGDGIIGRLLREVYPATRVTFVDFSDAMLDALRQRLSGAKRTAIIKADFSSRAWMEALGKHESFDIVVSGFAIHHQPDSRKRELYAEVFDLLAPGGVFLNLEHVSSLTPAGHALFDEAFVDSLVRFHRAKDPGKNREEIEKEYHRRPDKKENILAPLDTQTDWLRQIGFQDVDCFFKLFELALFGGRKPA